MALIPENAKHAAQIAAGTKGRKKGHSFEASLSLEINALPKPFIPTLDKKRHLSTGQPAQNLLNYIALDLGVTKLDDFLAVSTGDLATSETLRKSVIFKGIEIKKTKSDIIIALVVKNKEHLFGVSVKQCTNTTPTNAQLFFTTARAFCELLSRNSIPVSDRAIEAMRMFCGDEGLRPLDNPAYLKSRKCDPRRWFWEELPSAGRAELEAIFEKHQDKITRLLLQKAYAEDPCTPAYLIHQTKAYSSLKDCEAAIYSIDDLIKLSKKYAGFVKKPYTVRKGQYKDPPLTSHDAPRFGIVQMQRGGQKQHPTQLQFNLEAGYFYKLPTD